MSLSIFVTTNNVPRPLTYGYELTDEQRAEFDYIDWTQEESGFHEFVTYKGETYDVSEFQTTSELSMLSPLSLSDWDGYLSDSFFSGVVIKYPNHENYDHVVMGTYYSE